MMDAGPKDPMFLARRVVRMAVADYRFYADPTGAMVIATNAAQDAF